ncbi:phospholipase D/nuclease [Parathielavia appendiculata]|uniref:Phospholipase D/nuclease n=1 Tax=Parathielavia appendiculata TaxID=2587402 RepID=A0AAN6TVG2_9PEZI|nr:phospholipase D/nuclease [Parathielavia appendiculata]
MSYPQSFAQEFLRRLEAAPSSRDDIPRYKTHYVSERQLLVTSSQPAGFQLGTGASIFTGSLIPAIVSAQHEVIFVTCFWAPSKALKALCDALSKLAAHRLAAIKEGRDLRRGANAIPPLEVRICLSSRSLLQKLLHPQSRDGYTYPPSSWPEKLGLPDAALLGAAGIHVRVKSLFFLPFSVMHPKFVIIDRQRAFLPSCNVSWESWLEGCVEITGEAVEALLSFYSRTWDQAHPSRQLLHDRGSVFDMDGASLVSASSRADCRVEFQPGGTLPTLVLPSSCHRNPRFRPFPWQKAPTPPRTPLNIALLQVFEQARESIYIQTPNLTCEPVIAALLDSLARGVDVVIVTNRNMMLLEQLVTAGTTTSWSIRSLLRRFRRLKETAGTGAAHRDLEAGRPALGHLRISYFHARSSQADSVSHTREGRPLMSVASQEAEEPVHSHLKLTLVDGEYAMLGSGNMDRPSWFTSQELGILFHSHDFCTGVRAAVDGVLEERLELVFDSNDSR